MNFFTRLFGSGLSKADIAKGSRPASFHPANASHTTTAAARGAVLSSRRPVSLHTPGERTARYRLEVCDGRLY